MALLTDYVLTVSVSVAAGTAGITSVSRILAPFAVPILLGFIGIIAYGNLCGVKESCRLFAVPTYFVLFNMVVLLGYGVSRLVFGHLPVEAVQRQGMLGFGTSDGGLFAGVAIYVVLHAFASGGAAVTGVEAISNGVPAGGLPGPRPRPWCPGGRRRGHWPTARPR